MDTLMLEHGVRFGQAVSRTEVQKQNTAWVQIGAAVPPNHALPGLTVIACMSIEVPQEDEGISGRCAFLHPPQKRVVREHKQQ